ncbi:MAG: YggT family protein [Alphaproteobacteria bacterium]|nr:YggT family protein [Alphaproteobacteria bacterium]
MDIIIIPFIKILLIAINVYINLLIIAIIFDWLRFFNVLDFSNRFVAAVGHFLYQATNPPLQKIRRYVPTVGNIDFSPFVLILLLYFVSEVLARIALKF